MKTNQLTLKISNFLFAALLAVCILPFAGCGGDDGDDPIVDKLEAGTPVLKERTETVEAGKAVFSDAVEVPGTLYTKIGDKTETSTVKKETTLKSEATWASPITISALSGDIVKPTLTASASGLTFDFGAFKLDNAVKFTNPTYTLTESGKSAAIAFYGFNGGEATADPVVTSSVEGNKSVTTITQAFKIKHSDGTLTKECTLTAQYKEEITGPPVLTGYKLVSLEKGMHTEVFSTYLDYHFVVRRNYNYGAPSDTSFTYTFRTNSDGGSKVALLLKTEDFTVENVKKDPHFELDDNFVANGRNLLVSSGNFYIWTWAMKERYVDGEAGDVRVYYPVVKYYEGGLEPIVIADDDPDVEITVSKYNDKQYRALVKSVFAENSTITHAYLGYYSIN